MKSTFLFCCLLLASAAALGQTTGRRTALFDAGWRFHRGGAQGADAAAFDDAAWRTLDLPHDWSIEDLPGTASPFSPDASSQVSGGFTSGGTGWYRKTFAVPAGPAGQRVQLQFDGVYMNAEVWVNGHSVGRHPYGYTSFAYDITDQVKFGAPNVVAVQVQHEGPSSRWYSGSGIYRHVWLARLAPVHVAPWGTYLTTPEVTAAAAQVSARTTVVNTSAQAADFTLITRLRDPRGREVARAETRQTAAAGATVEVGHTLALPRPQRWSLDRPALYTALTEVRQQGQLLDQVSTPFGVRTISFDAATGFRLNGQPLKLKGGCLHHDNGPLGARAYDRAEERKVELLKASGYNALRLTHNPPAPALLDACDRLGMLVIDEAFDMWREAKNPYDYHLYFDQWWPADVTSLVQRDRNHPAVVLWSIGNEIPESARPEGAATARQLADFVRGLDPTRPVTAAVNGLGPGKDAYLATLDVAGYNYAAGGDHNQADLYAADHARLPGRVILGTESYPLEAFGSWMSALDHPYVVGDFVWTAWDYIGEASIGWRGYFQQQNFYPWNLAYCGDFDICGWKRPQSYYRDALWRPNQVAVFVQPPTPSFPLNPQRESWSKWHWADDVASWNWAGQEGRPLQVRVYSSCEQVELQLNGKSLGRQSTNRATQFTATWAVPYQAGTLKAVGYQGAKAVQTSVLQTAGPVTQLRLSADRSRLRADGQDLSYVTVELVDDQGVRHPQADGEVRFVLEGPGTIVGVGNANPTSLESYQLPQRQAWQGRCLVVVKAGAQAGQLLLKATAAGLKPAALALTTQAGIAPLP